MWPDVYISQILNNSGTMDKFEKVGKEFWASNKGSIKKVGTEVFKATGKGASLLGKKGLDAVKARQQAPPK